MLSAISEMPIGSFIAVAQRGHGVTEFVARNACLTAVVERVQWHDVPRLVIESRDDDREDERHLIRVRQPEPWLVFEHRRGSAEPMLWVADAIAWAHGAGASWLRLVEPVVEDVTELRPKRAEPDSATKGWQEGPLPTALAVGGPKHASADGESQAPSGTLDGRGQSSLRLVARRLRTGAGAGLAVTLLSLPLMGCSGSDNKPTFAVVERYVALLGGGDFEGAMALRCSDAQVGAGDSAQFLNELDRLGKSAGVPLEVVDAEEVADGKLLASNGATPHREIRFRLRTKAGSSQPIHVVTVINDGKELLCGYSVEESFALRDRLAETPIEANPTHIEDLQGVIEHAEKSFTNSIANAGPAGQPDGTGEQVEEAWGTFWRTGDFGGVTVDAYRFADTTSAKKAAADLLNRRAPDGTTTFEVLAMPKAIGLRQVASAWTWLQPADLGDQVDLVVAVYDDVVVWIAASPLSADGDHALVNSVAEDIAP